jgi:hypothetical protein
VSEADAIRAMLEGVLGLVGKFMDEVEFSNSTLHCLLERAQYDIVTTILELEDIDDVA